MFYVFVCFSIKVARHPLLQVLCLPNIDDHTGIIKMLVDPRLMRQTPEDVLYVLRGLHLVAQTIPFAHVLSEIFSR